MLPVCDALHITVNELLSGETLDTFYQEKAEENLLGLIKEKEKEKISGKKYIMLQAISLLGSIILWLLLFADSNVYQLGDSPTHLTLGYLIVGFISIYLVIMTTCYGIMKKDSMMIFAALSFASFVCLLICLGYCTFWLILPAIGGMFLCFALSLWSYFKNKSTKK